MLRPFLLALLVLAGGAAHAQRAFVPALAEDRAALLAALRTMPADTTRLVLRGQRHVDADVLRTLESQRALRILDLAGCPRVDDQALDALHGCAALRWVATQRTAVTAKGRAALHAALPALRSRAIDARIESAMREQQLVGLAVALLSENWLVHARGFGLADREKGVPVDTNTLFRWASISKTLTAIRALQLVEAGRLDLDRDVREYVPEFPDKGTAITTRQLLGHLGGIVHYRNGKVVRTRREYDAEHPFADVVLALDMFKESPLIAPPGTKYAYSTHGYLLAGAAVQRAGGVPFAAQIHEHITEPLGMTSLRPDYAWEKIPGRAIGYRRIGPLVVPSSDTDVSWKLPGGGYLSNIEDLGRLGLAWLRRELLRPESYAALWTAQRTTEGKATRYGLGFSLSGEGDARRLGHSGAQEKTRTYLWIAPEQGFGVALMTNSEHAKLRPLVDALMRLLAQD